VKGAPVDDQLQQLIELQREQNQLLKKHLWRLRFSLLSLLILTTITAVGLGVVTYQTRPTNATPPSAPIRLNFPQAAPAGPTGDIELRVATPGQS